MVDPPPAREASSSPFGAPEDPDATRSPAAEPNVLEDLCLSCGLCCDGSLFECVEVEAEEQAAFRGVKLVMVDERPAVPLPCCMHVTRRCSIYARRPARCVTFTCQLYREVEEQRVAVVDAGARIAEVHALLRRIESRLGWEPGTYTTTRFRQWVADYCGGEAQARREHPLVLLDYGISRRLMERHLIPPRQKR